MLDARGRLLIAALGFAGLSMPSYDRALWALRMWLDSWPGVAEVTRIFSAMPGLQLVFLALAFVTWLAGANLVVAYHYKRVGKSAWSGFKPFASPPFRHFNAKEWLNLAGFAALALTFAGFAYLRNPR